MNEEQQRLARELLRNLKLLTGLTAAFLVVLAAAPFKWHNSEWRDVQRDYNRRAKEQGVATISVGLKQIWRPEAAITDRCPSCHLGMGAAEPLESGGVLHGRHPDVGHDVSRMGCTLCHRGQGRATRAQAAHGDVEHWDDPMLPVEYLEASCGSCHGDAVRIPSVERMEQGVHLFELYGCSTCHKVDGMGGDVGPDLSGIALKRVDKEELIRHFRNASVANGSDESSIADSPDSELDSLFAYLDTLVMTPKLVRGKAVAMRSGCRGCHKIAGLGGDVSIDLHEATSKRIVDYDYDHIEGEHTLVNWHREHLRDPQRVAPGSRMPRYRLAEEDEEALITYILSLRRPYVPLEKLPKGTLLSMLQERRDFDSDGAAVFGVFCAGCHGEDGRGQIMPALRATVPDLRNAESLSIVSAESLRYMIEHGRPGRAMPAWGVGEAGLTNHEIAALVDYLLGALPTPPSFDEVAGTRPDLRVGAKVFESECSACHGAEGEGTGLAPSLTNASFLFLADDAFLYKTITKGRTGTGMPAHSRFDATTIASLIAWIRSLGQPGERETQAMSGELRDVLLDRRLTEFRASGSSANGKVVYGNYCVDCHGEDGRGGAGPALANRSFLAAASDGFLAGSILLGREDGGMPSFGPRGLDLSLREVDDLIAYLRSGGSETPRTLGYGTVDGTPENGRELYIQHCQSCHGTEGSGDTAPALNNSVFLEAVTDGFLQATIVRGRPGTAMPSWARDGFEDLDRGGINDIVAYIRAWQSKS